MLLSMVVAFTAGSSLAQDVLLTFPTNSIFATNGLAGAWHWWGGATTTTYFDPSTDAGGDLTSGSIKFEVTWPTGSGADYQYSIGLALSGKSPYDTSIRLSTTTYTNFECDVLWDTNSTINITNHVVGGDPTGFGLGFVATQYGQSWVPNANQPVLVSNIGWQHFSIPLNPVWPDIPGMIFKKYMGYNTNNEGTTSKFWVDNLKFKYNTSTVVPKPVMLAKKATKGLNLIAAQSGSQYQRNSVRSIPADTHQWYGNTNPVTYSVTIGDFPDGSTHSGYQGHIFLSTDGGTTEPDWNNPNVIMVQFQENGNGSGACNFRFKTNSPNSNGQGSSGFFGTGAIMNMTAPTILGTWSVTFTNNSHITVVGPGGVSTNFDMGADAAAFFISLTPSMATYFGGLPGQPNNIGYGLVYSRIRVTDGTNSVVDDRFPLSDPTQESDPTLWINELDAPYPGAIKVVDQDAFWVDWNKPDGFLANMQISSNLMSGWNDTALPILDHGSRRAEYVGTNTTVNYPAQAFFRLWTTNSP